MAKKSKIARNERRRGVVERYAARRAELKEIIRRPSAPGAEGEGAVQEAAVRKSAVREAAVREAAVRELRRQPRDASATRVRNRDAVDGRPRGHLRKFGISRVRLREQAHAGFLPGVRKASW
ncbi:30S ribosomal protein S14 [Streptomyces sp. NPDC058579]|uniref:30S ribosomal protein S14 n=1 Tax=Streptomyces sp. NPDC058579 TaxID=3346548 RepID=UPI003646DBD6